MSWTGCRAWLLENQHQELTVLNTMGQARDKDKGVRTRSWNCRDTVQPSPCCSSWPVPLPPGERMALAHPLALSHSSSLFISTSVEPELPVSFILRASSMRPEALSVAGERMGR
jgi:hypothetical protein